MYSLTSPNIKHGCQLTNHEINQSWAFLKQKKTRILCQNLTGQNLDNIVTRNKNDKLRQEMCGEDKRYIYYNLSIPQFFMKMRKYAFLHKFIKAMVRT